MYKLFSWLTIVLGVSSYDGLLQESLLTNYRRDVLPLINNSKVDVSLGMALRAINNINQLDGTIIFNVWFRYKWHDENLVWNGTPLVVAASPSSHLRVSPQFVRSRFEHIL